VGGEGENHKDGVTGSCLIASDAESLVEGFTGVMGDRAGEEEVEDVGVGIPVPFAVTTSAALHTLLHLRIIQHTLIDGELNGLRCWLSPQVRHSCLQTFHPPIDSEVARQLPKCWGKSIPRFRCRGWKT
jgi:hypothetical protein